MPIAPCEINLEILLNLFQSEAQVYNNEQNEIALHCLVVNEQQMTTCTWLLLQLFYPHLPAWQLEKRLFIKN